MTEETIAKDSPSGYQPATKVATSVAVRPILKGVVYAIARPELKLYMQPEQTAKVAQQISVLLSEVIGVSGGTVERINEYELCGYFLDPADMVVGLPSIWKQFRSAVLRIENVESCTLTLSGHVGTVYVEEFAKGDRRTFKPRGRRSTLRGRLESTSLIIEFGSPSRPLAMPRKRESATLFTKSPDSFRKHRGSKFSNGGPQLPLRPKKSRQSRRIRDRHGFRRWAIWQNRGLRS